MRGSARTWRVRAGEDETTVAWDPPTTTDSDVVFICAHGAGGHMADRSVLSLRDALGAHGIGLARFNFFYRARGSGRPDPMPKLLTCLRVVIEQVRNELHPAVLILGGRSMGGRAASVLVSEGSECDGLLLLAYPLHPPGQPDKLRSAHLSSIQAPVLCVNGTRDAFCDRGRMEQVLSHLDQNWRMQWIDGADHGFHVLKSSGRTDRDVLAEVAGAVAHWVRGLPNRSPEGESAP